MKVDFYMRFIGILYCKFYVKTAFKSTALLIIFPFFLNISLHTTGCSQNEPTHASCLSLPGIFSLFDDVDEFYCQRVKEPPTFHCYVNTYRHETFPGRRIEQRGSVEYTVSAIFNAFDFFLLIHFK